MLEFPTGFSMSTFANGFMHVAVMMLMISNNLWYHANIQGMEKTQEGCRTDE